jgi:succinate dehydrogenase / fumarate reductase cytochrome b subunit
MAGWFARNHFLLRRLHSLSGIVPVGVFLTVHLVTNASILGGPEVFQERVNAIHALGPLLPAVEILGILLPIAFHACLGVRIWLSSTNNTPSYAYGANIRYRFQRLTGVVAMAFILYHLWHMHWLGGPLGGGKFDAHAPMAAASAARALQSSIWIAFVYGLGILAATYHFSNGIWTFLITWGVTVGPSAQRKASWVCMFVGLGLAAVGLAALVKFRSTPPHKLVPAEWVTSPGGDGHG